MKMQDLVKYRFPNKLIKIWEKHESPDLLPIQARAIEEFAILSPSSKNLLVITPTSSGKTFLGELAAVKEALEMRRALFLVPYRAIAEELYAGLTRKYSDYGIGAVISDRDHREFDEDIISGSYQIAVIVYEKLAGLLVMNPDLLKGCALVVADEVQMMMDNDRGPTIELLLTKIILSDPRVRLIALSAVLDKLNEFDRWLKAKVLKDNRRPIELRESIYNSDGSIIYREFNSKNRGNYNLSPWDDANEGLLNLVQSVMDESEQILVFCSTRPDTTRVAGILAESLSGVPAAVETIKKANDLADSSTRESLQNLLQKGVAYHNSDLSLEERLLVEEGFRNKEIRVLACTSTLAMGVNVPARNTLIYNPQKWDGSIRAFVPISVAEYKNMAGRAGRYYAGDIYGRSFLLANSQAQNDTYFLNYITGELEGFSSSFGDQDIDSQVLEVIAGGLAEDAEEVQEFVFSTFNGLRKWTTQTSKTHIKEMIDSAISKCLEFNAVNKNSDGYLEITDSGKICAAGGYQLAHLGYAGQYVNDIHDDIALSLIFWALETDSNTGSNAYHIPRLRTQQYQSGRYQNMFLEIAEEDDVGPLLKRFVSNPYFTYEQCVILRRTLACYAWISNIPTRKMEEHFPGIAIGAIRNTAEVVGWILSLLSELMKKSNLDSDRYKIIEDLRERLAYGVTKEALGLCQIERNGLSRDERNHLGKEGIKGVDDILRKNVNEIPLPQAKAIRLMNAAENTIKNHSARRKRRQITRLASISVDSSLVIKLYEKEGRELETAINDLLQEPFLGLTCRHVTKQNEGEPDHLIYDSNENVLAVQTTARERKNISFRKATSVIGQSSKYNPVGYIIFGRPDFQNLAIEDSVRQTKAGFNYKLIPIHVLAEMYVLFKEGALGSGDVGNILTNWTGYINTGRIYQYLKSKE